MQNGFFNIFEAPQWAVYRPKCGYISDTIILMVDYESDLFIPSYMKSLYNFANKKDFTLLVWNNSNVGVFNWELYNDYGFDNIMYFNNMPDHQNDEIRHIYDFKWIGKKTVCGSPVHAVTIQYVIDLLIKNGIKNLILTDSDIIFKNNPLNIIDNQYLTVGSIDEIRNRIHPCLQYINLDKIKEKGFKFFESDKIIGLNGSMDYHYFDTGYSFTKLCEGNTKIFNLEDYAVHFGGASFAYSSNEDKFNSIKGENQPKLAWDMIWSWIIKHLT